MSYRNEKDGQLSFYHQIMTVKMLGKNPGTASLSPPVSVNAGIIVSLLALLLEFLPLCGDNYLQVCIFL